MECALGLMQNLWLVVEAFTSDASSPGTFFLGFNINSCVKSLFGTVSMEMRRNITQGHSCI